MDKGALFALSLLGLGLFMYSPKLTNKPRGIRNNNPLNIRDNPNNKWDGLIGVDEKGFCKFVTPEHGYRAAAKTLMSYKRRNIVTLRDIIYTWTPPNGMDNNGDAYTNPTLKYLEGVSEKTGINAGEAVEEQFYPQLFAAMTIHENGVNPYSIETIKKGVGMAYGR